jgi:hypothetical protein
MTPGLTEEQAATTFLNDHGAVFGGPLSGGELETALEWSSVSPDGDFVVFAYTQKIRGKPVEGSHIRIRVKRGPVLRVDYASGRLSGEPTVGAEQPVLPADAARILAIASGSAEGFVVDGTPELIALRGNARRPDAWCWRVAAHEGAGPRERNRTYFVDTSSPRVVQVQDHSWGIDPPTTGVVGADGTPAAAPWLPYGSAPSLTTHLMPGMLVTGVLSGGASASAYTDDTGTYSLSLGSSGQAIQVTGFLGDPGAWYQVYVPPSSPQNPPIEFISASGQTTVSSSLNLVLTDSVLSEEFRAAQSDAVFSLNRSRNFFMTYISSTASRLGLLVYIEPNSPIAGSYTADLGSAFSVSFSQAAGDLRNFATHTAICHEYGHVALSILGISAADQRAFHEGFADSYSYMVNDTSVMGPQQTISTGAPIRPDPSSSAVDCQYPLGALSPCLCSDPYQAGQLLSGPWVRIRVAFEGFYGATTGLQYARKLFGKWALITIGGDDQCDSADPHTLHEVAVCTKTSDQLSMVCQAFSQHGITSQGDCGP